MNENILISIYFSTLFLLAANILFVVLKKYRIAKVSGVLTFICALTAVVMIFIQSGHLPMSGTFEKMQNIVLIVILLGLYYDFRNRKNDFVSYEYWIVAIVFQALVLFDEMKTDQFYYMYDVVWVKLFFQFRLISVAILAFAFSQYLTALRLKTGSEEKTRVVLRAGNFTLLGAIIFLCGEFSGSVWAQLGYGDAWRWSKNFFFSGGMFLLSLLGSHLSPSWLKSVNTKIYLSMIPVLVIIILFLI
jgi:hypothetical protein